MFLSVVMLQVATIGDAYMLSSGLPIRNGTKHAGEMCAFSLVVLQHLEGMEIAHIPGRMMQLRIGIHTGTNKLCSMVKRCRLSIGPCNDAVITGPYA